MQGEQHCTPRMIRAQTPRPHYIPTKGHTHQFHREDVALK